MSCQINHRLLIALVVSLLLLVGAGYVTHEIQAGRLARQMLAEADAAEQQGELAQAAVCLHRYLIFRPDDTAILIRYALVLDRTAKTPTEQWRVVGVFEQILARHPAQVDIRRRLAVRAVRLGWYSEARTHLEYLLQEAPAQGELESLLGQCYERDDKPQQAAVYYRSAIQHAPQVRLSYLRLAHLLEHRLHQPHKAEEVLTQLIKKHPDYARGWYARGAFRVAQDSVQEGANDLAEALKRAPNDPDVLQLSARLCRQQLRPGEARICLERGCRLQPRNPSWYLSLASLELGEGRTREATLALRQGLRVVPAQPDLAALLGQILIEQKQYGEVEKTIASLRTPQAPPRLADLLQGWLLLEQQSGPQAVPLLEEVAGSSESSPEVAARAHLLLARWHEREGASDRCLAELRSAVERAPRWPVARLCLAAMLRSQGLVDEVIQQYQQLILLPQPPEETWALLGQALLQRAQASSVRRADLAEVERLLKKAELYPSQKVPVALLRAEVLLAQKQPEQAHEILEKAHKSHPGEVSLVIALANLERQQGRLTRATELLAGAKKAGRNPLQVYGAELSLCPLLPPGQALHVLENVEKSVSSLPPVERVPVLLQLARTSYQMGQVEAGQRFCHKLADLQPADAPALTALLELAWLGGDSKLLERLTPQLRQREGELPGRWQFGEAARLVLAAQGGDKNNRKEAERLLDDVSRRWPDWAAPTVLLGQLAEQDRDSARASAAYLRAFDHGERSSIMVLRLVHLLMEQGRFAQADDVLRRLEQAARLSGPLARVAADLALRNHNFDRALALAREAAPEDSRDHRQHLWYGHVLDTAGRHSDAESAFQRALDLRDDLPETWLAFFAHLVHSDHRLQAETLLETMKHRLPPEDLPLSLALAYETLGQPAQARQWYETALTRQPDDGLVLQRGASYFLRLGQTAQAEPLLRRMLQAEISLPAASQAWARRQLALLLAFGNGKDGYRQAVDLLTQTRQAGQEQVVDQRARLLVEGTQPKGQSKALAELEELARAGVLSTSELFCLVRLHEAGHRPDLARKEMIEVLTLDSGNPEYLAYHIERLLERNKKEEARPWLARLERIEPTSGRVQAFRKQLASSGRFAPRAMPGATAQP